MLISNEFQQEYKKTLLRFIADVKDTFREDPYEFEICATDLWCLQQKVKFEQI